MTLRALFTAAILAGLAAAPDAQSFRWEPNSRGYDISARVERAFEQAQRNIERQWRQAERMWEQRARNAERQERARVQRQINDEIRANVRANVVLANRLAPRMARVAGAAESQVGTDADPCRDSSGDRDYYQHCEVRESTLPAGALHVDAGQNGGVSVEAWDRNDIRVRAIVRGSARSNERAREITGQVQVQAGGGKVYATGPDLDRREWWSVSYRINVPRRNDLDLSATNGGITIAGVTGNLRFDTTNGGVTLRNLGGRVNGETRNGGLNVVLTGSRWDGDGIDVQTSNGGVTVDIPENYNAELETRTVNGGLNIDFPITVQGELTSRRGISTTLGSGGPLVRVRTTNGGVRIRRSN